ncbi:MAG: glycosyltransferase [Lachnospiraceae bacterium]|nr:glycosyltransferase [Lachnospiraceae bacterium]
MKMKQQPLISVIIPVYKAEKTIRRAAESALNQTWKNLEVLLVVDGSPDGSGRICDALAGEDSRVRVFYMEDRGVSAARNRGLEEMRGEYHTFVDSDDAIAPQMLSALYRAICEEKADIAGCMFSRCTEEADFQRLLQEKEQVKNSSAAVLTGQQIVSQGILNGDSRCWSKLYGPNCRNVRFKEGLTIGEDMLYFLQCLGPATRYAALQEPLYAYYINPQGAMERPFAPNHMDQLRCWKLAQDEISERFPEILSESESAAKLAAIRAVYAVLTAGKIARLPGAQARSFSSEYGRCREQLREVLAVRGCFGALSNGYKIKAVLLQLCPGIYQKLYGALTGKR